MEKTILQLFPQEYRPLWQKVAGMQEKIQEIRLRVGQPVLIYCGGKECFLSESGEVIWDKNHRTAPVHIVSDRELEHILQHICHYSPYAYEDELRRGFLTVTGGHRVGVTGQVVAEGDGSIRTLKNVSFLNIRVSHQVKGAADEVLFRLYRNQRLKNVLIISPPGCGKTTLLRDMIRQISDGNGYGEGMTVGVVDERSEIAGAYMGVPRNDVGMRTDVLDGCKKKEGVLMLLRAMSPKVIALDEVGAKEEWEVLRQAGACGCKILATVHGESIADVERRFEIDRVQLEKLFDLFLILGKRDGQCVVEHVEEAGGEMNDEIAGSRYDFVGVPWVRTMV